MAARFSDPGQGILDPLLMELATAVQIQCGCERKQIDAPFIFEELLPIICHYSFWIFGITARGDMIQIIRAVNDMNWSFTKGAEENYQFTHDGLGEIIKSVIKIRYVIWSHYNKKIGEFHPDEKEKRTLCGVEEKKLVKESMYFLREYPILPNIIRF